MNNDIEKQIESILAITESKATAEAMRTFAHGIAVFYLELQSSGLSEDEAMELTLAAIDSINGTSR